MRKNFKYSYKDIAALTGKKAENVRALVNKLGIEKRIVRGVTKLDEEGLKTLEMHYTPKISRFYDAYKIRVIERYIVTKSCRDVSEVCRKSRVTVRKIIKEWKETGCIIVESRMNFTEQQQNRGIFYRNDSWGYSFNFKNKRYYKRGFEKESDAVHAMLKLKEGFNGR